MKKIRSGFFVLLLLLLISSPCYGKENNNTDYSSLTNAIYEKANMSKLDMYGTSLGNDNIFMYSNFKEYVKDIASGNYKFNYDEVLGNLKDLFFRGLKDNIKILVNIIALCIFLSLINLLNTSFMEKEISDIAFFAVFLALISFIIKAFFNIITLSYTLIKTITGFMNILLPIIIILLNLGGNVFSGNIISISLVFALNFFASIMTFFIIPAISFGFILSMVNNLLIDINISYLISFIKQAIIFVMGMFATLFTIIMSTQSIMFSSLDSFLLKTTKFTISSLVPIMGSLISDSADTVIGFVKVIKGAVGVFGVFILLSIVLVPLLNVLCFGLMLKFSSILCEPIVEQRVSKTLNEASSFVMLLFACFLVCVVLFIILIGIMAMIGGGG